MKLLAMRPTVRQFKAPISLAALTLLVATLLGWTGQQEQSRPQQWHPAFEVAFIGAWIAAGINVLRAARSRTVESRLEVREGLTKNLRANALTCAAAALGPTLVAITMNGPPAALMVACGILSLQAATTALAASRLPMPTGLQLFTLVAFAWWIPALVPPSFVPGLAQWVRLPVQWARADTLTRSATEITVAIAPIIGILIAVWIGSHGTGRDSPPQS